MKAETHKKITVYCFIAIWACGLSLLVFWMISQMWIGGDTRTIMAEMKAQEIAATNEALRAESGDLSKADEFFTVYEITKGDIQAKALFHLAISLLLFIAGIFGFFISQKRIHKGIFIIVTVVSIEYFMAHMELFVLARSDIKRNTRITEGLVHVSRVAGLHKPGFGDEITLGGQTLRVDYAHAVAGYKQTIIRGGVLRGGVYARLHCVNDVILKVELKGRQIDKPNSLTTKIFWSLVATLILLILGCITNILMFYKRFIQPCLDNLQQITAAKEQWAASNRKADGEAVDITEVNQYIKGRTTPVCPQGGTYSYKNVGEKPTCTCLDKTPRNAKRKP